MESSALAEPHRAYLEAERLGKIRHFIDQTDRASWHEIEDDKGRVSRRADQLCSGDERVQIERPRPGRDEDQISWVLSV